MIGSAEKQLFYEIYKMFNILFVKDRDLQPLDEIALSLDNSPKSLEIKQWDQVAKYPSMYLSFIKSCEI